MSAKPAPELTDRERQLVAALRDSWHLMNSVRARDGVAYHYGEGIAYCTEEYWGDVVEKAALAIEAITGERPKPWPFSWER